MTGAELRQRVLTSLRKQGFRFCDGRLSLPRDADKDRIRGLHAIAVEHKQERAEPALMRYEGLLLRSFASGRDVTPEAICPRLVEVRPGSHEELLFRYAALHWKVPVSSGYGRRLRFLVMDDHNAKLIGIIGLGDPVFSLSIRDSWIGWETQARKNRLRNVLDAFVLGSVPPYSQLLCGKLVAMLVASDEIRQAFSRKYHGTVSLISQKKADARLALVTTLSALGRSSVYNRIKYHDRLLYHPLGFSQGSGEFQFSNGLYHAISSYANRYCSSSAKNESWGSGFRNRREVVRKCLMKIKLSPDALMYHGIAREVFAVPLAANSREFLCGENERLRWYHQSGSDLFEWFRERWLLPQAQRDRTFEDFEPQSLRLWRNP